MVVVLGNWDACALIMKVWQLGMIKLVPRT